MRTRALLCALCIFLVIGIAGSPAWAQTTVASPPDNGPNTSSPLGIEPGASAAGTNESINLMNGSVNLFIPLISFPQRSGYSMGLGYVHHSNSLAFQQAADVSGSGRSGSGSGTVLWNVFTYEDSLQSYDPLLNINLPRLQFSYEFVGSQVVEVGGINDHIANFFCATNFVFTDWSGNKHPFENITMCNSQTGATDPQQTFNTTDASDGSFYQLNTTNANDITVVAKNGTVYNFTGYANLFPPPNQPGDPGPNNQENAWDSRASSIVDPNKNTISISTQLVSNSLVYTVTDTVGRVITISSAGLSYKDSNGNPQQIKLQLTPSSTTSINTGLSCVAGSTQPPNPPPTVTTISTLTAPQSTLATITFPVPTGGSGQRVYNVTFDSLSRVSKVQYPAGGYTRYDYQGGLSRPTQSNVTCTGGTWEIAHKYECPSASGSCSSENTTTYTPTIVGQLYDGMSFNSQMIEKDPIGNTEVHQFATTTPTRTNPQETYIKTYNVGGTLVRTIQKQYPPITANSDNIYSYDITFPSSITTTLNDGSPAVTTVTNIADNEYTASLPYEETVLIDNPKTITTTDYSGGTIRSISEDWKDPSSFSVPHILDRLHYITTTDPSGLSNTVTNGYDDNGNITSVTKNGTNTGSYETDYLPDEYGNITRITDPLGNPTTIGYQDNWSSASQTCVTDNSSAYPTLVTNALGQMTKYSYNACTGTIASVTDPNGVVTSYGYEAQGRVTSKMATDASHVLAASTSVVYADTPTTNNYVELHTSPSSPYYAATVTTKVAQDASHSLNTEEDVDGFGRELHSTLVTDPQGGDMIDVAYDALGNKISVSNRHRAYSSPSDGTTSYAYDVLHRVLMQCNPDNGTLPGSCAAGSSYKQWHYAGNVTDLYDEQLHHWQQTDDALGELTAVKEPNSSNSPALETDYSYQLGNLTGVNQKGTGSDVARSRTFVYDGLSRLVEATNPESGTTCYGIMNGTCAPGYDGNGNLKNRTDAWGTVTSYTYDALNRLVTKSYSPGAGVAATPTVRYYYDTPSSGWGWPAQTSPSYPSTSQTNLVGRLEGVNVGTGPYAWIVYSYDALGRVNIKSECLPIDCGNNHHDMRRTYNMAGELTFYDRGLDVDRNSAYPNQGYYFGGYNLSYDGAGNVSQATGDTAGTNTATNIFTNTDYFPNGQLYTAQILGTYNDKFSVNTRGWYTGEILTNSGGTTMWQSTTARNNVGNVVSTTDTAAGHWAYVYDQLNRMLAAAGPQGTTSYALDDFGNMSGKTITAGTGFPLAGLQPAPNNSLVGNGLQYDLGTLANPAGNITNDGFHQYMYDAEGRLSSMNNGTTCFMYDGEGRRVAKTNCSSNLSGILAEYLYDSDGRLLTELNPISEKMSRANIYAGGRFIAEDSPDSNYTTATATQMRVLDQVGSLRGLLDLGQHVVSSYNGGPVGDGYTCSASGEDMLFTGEKCDSESALDYFGARYYTSTLGRFTSPDSSGRPVALPYASLSNPQSLNLYSYVENNPVGIIDVDGHQIRLGPPSCAGDGSIGCSPEQKEQSAAQGAAQQQGSNSSSGRGGFLSNAGQIINNFFHGHGFVTNAELEGYVTTVQGPGEVKSESEPSPYVTLALDVFGVAGLLNGNQRLAQGSAIASGAYDPSPLNLGINGAALVEGVFGDAFGPISLVNDAGYLSGGFVTYNVMAPMLKATPGIKMPNENGQLIDNPAETDLCQEIGCN